MPSTQILISVLEVTGAISIVWGVYEMFGQGPAQVAGGTLALVAAWLWDRVTRK